MSPAPRPDSFFSLDGPVGPGRRNDPRDVIKVQTLLGNSDRGSFGRFQGPLGILQDEDEIRTAADPIRRGPYSSPRGA